MLEFTPAKGPGHPVSWVLGRWQVWLLSLILGLTAPIGLKAQTCLQAEEWPAWSALQARALSPQGRLVDDSDPRHITTSEGQSYALFFALVNNDRAVFERILNWTERHLAKGDLSARLPAWLWGQGRQGMGVLDPNSAADSDLWIAYSLLEAGRLWQSHRYAALGTLLLQRIAREEVAHLPDGQVVLLGGRQGFVHDDYWVTNPSYMVPQLYDRFAQALPNGPWAALRASLPEIWIQMSPKGVAPDWSAWSADSRAWGPVPDRPYVGGYDAIRVYLWVGMMAAEAPDVDRLTRHFGTIAERLGPDGQVPGQLDVLSGQTDGVGPTGFAAALLPLLQDQPQADALRRRMQATRFDRSRYYDQVLTLFAEGWLQGRYRFDVQGRLMTRWTPCS